VKGSVHRSLMGLADPNAAIDAIRGTGLRGSKWPASNLGRMSSAGRVKDAHKKMGAAVRRRRHEAALGLFRARGRPWVALALGTD